MGLFRLVVIVHHLIQLHPLCQHTIYFPEGIPNSQPIFHVSIDDEIHHVPELNISDH